MDFPVIHIGAIFATLMLLAMIFYNLWSKNPHNNRKDLNISYPPQPFGAWPIIGHLHLLNSQNHIAHTLSTLADKYGPIFTLRLGTKRAVIISSREAVMECFMTNDNSLADRPKSSFGEHLVYNHASLGFTYDPYWSDMRKIISFEVFSSSRLKEIKKLQECEISSSIWRLYNEVKRVRPSKVVISRWIEEMSLNMVVKLIVGKRYESGRVNGDKAKEEESFREVIREIAYLSGQFVISDVIPIPLLRWMDFQGHIKNMKRVSKELENIIHGWIDEHIKRRVMKDKLEAEDEGFIDVILSTLDDKMMINAPQLIIIKTFVVNIILGTFDTISMHLIRLLSVLTNHEEVLQHAQQEIDIKIGNQRWIQESDINNLPYLQAIIKETLRLYPPLPLSIPHVASKNFQLSGYFVPKGTQLFVNLWKLHKDPRFWPEPERFVPERFLTGSACEVDFYKGMHFEFVPFGSGQRSCPGVMFAMQVIGLTLARLIQGFDFDRPVDVSEGVCVDMVRENDPLEVMVKPRLPLQMYEEL